MAAVLANVWGSMQQVPINYPNQPTRAPHGVAERALISVVSGGVYFEAATFALRPMSTAYSTTNFCVALLPPTTTRTA